MDQPITAGQSEITGTPLAGHHALVTGAGRGIGAAVADYLARLGADLTLIGRTAETLEKRAASLSSEFGVRAMSHVADVADLGAVEGAFDAARAGIGPPDILINNAGVAMSAPLVRTDPERWDEVIAVNLRGVFLCARAALGDMTERGFGRIVNIASVAGLEGYPYITAYCASKHGVIGLTRALALETAKTGVTVNAVCPGYTDTDMVRRSAQNIAAKTGLSPDAALAELVTANPHGRLIAPEEVARVVAWLSLPESSSITGQAIAIPGEE